MPDRHVAEGQGGVTQRFRRVSQTRPPRPRRGDGGIISGMATLRVHLPDDLLEQLRAAATSEGLTVDAALVQAAEGWLTAHAHRSADSARLRRALDDDPALRALLGDD